MEIIAQKQLIAVSKATGERQEVVLEIFKPRPTDDGQDYFCLAQFNGLEGESFDVGGVDGVQALFLAINQTKKRFAELQEQHDFFWMGLDKPLKSLDFSVENEILQKKVEKAMKYAAEPERFTVEDKKVTLKSDHGLRNITLKNDQWVCDCDFYQENNICSHTIATKKFLT